MPIIYRPVEIDEHGSFRPVEINGRGKFHLAETNEHEEPTPTESDDSGNADVKIDVQAVIKKLGANKNVFLNGIETKVKNHIASKTWQECLTIVQLNDDDSIQSTWNPEVSKAYLERLYAFIRENKYMQNGIEYALDSGLTQEIVEVVTEEFKAFYTSDDFSKILLKQLIKDKVFIGALSRAIIEASNGSLPETMRNQLAQKLADVLQKTLGDTLSQNLLPVIGAVVGKAVSLVVATGISHAVLAVMLNKIVVLLQGVLANVLATTAIKATLISLVKKAAAAKIIALLVAFLAPILTKIAATLSIPVTYFLILAIVAVFVWIIQHEVEKLPKNMSEQVSKAVRDELDGNFAQLNNNVVTVMMKSFTAATFAALATDIAGEVVKNPEFMDNLARLRNGE